jgi:hypothetical protein
MRAKKSGGFEYAFSIPCLKCRKDRVVKRRQHAISMSKKPCKTCSNKDNKPVGLVGQIRASFFNKFTIGASQRNKIWNIDISYAAQKFDEQGGVCALSGLQIDAGGSGCALSEITASLDRVDNAVGYEPGNVQWVHKELNMMRGSLTVDRFKELCAYVASHNKVRW